MSTPFSAGALYSTTEDLLRWESALFGGKLLSPASLAKMITPFKNNYALGVGVNMGNGRKQISHGGGINGFNTFLAYYPETKITVAALCNKISFVANTGQSIIETTGTVSGDEIRFSQQNGDDVKQFTAKRVSE